MITKIIHSIRKNGLYMAFWYKWSIISSYLHLNKKLITPHRDTWYKNKLKKYLKYSKSQDFTLQEKVPNQIWLLWFQGINNAPEIIKKCHSSVNKYCKGYKITILDNSNINEYIELPLIIKNKWEKKLIPAAQYSDIIRLAILNKYGGIWMDATCLLTNEFPSFIRNSFFFMFKTDKISTFNSHLCSSWFIKTPANNPILVDTFNLMIKYHEKNKYLKDYFLIHQIISIVVENNYEYKKIWEEIPYIPNILPHLLQLSFPNRKNKDYIDEIYNISTIHKLTYKIPNNILKDKSNNYHYILKIN